MTGIGLLDSWLLRTGRKVGRTLYLTPPTDPDGDGILIGLVDSEQLAAEIARRWNLHQGVVS